MAKLLYLEHIKNIWYFTLLYSQLRIMGSLVHLHMKNFKTRHNTINKKCTTVVNCKRVWSTYTCFQKKGEIAVNSQCLKKHNLFFGQTVGELLTQTGDTSSMQSANKCHVLYKHQQRNELTSSRAALHADESKDERSIYVQAITVHKHMLSLQQLQRASYNLN